MPALPSGTVTFLFTDIEGSTRLVQRLGDVTSEQVFTNHRRLLRQAIEATGGAVVEDQGESFLFVFPGAREAVLAAVAAQRALAAHSWPEGLALRVRMGLHTGEPASTREGYVGVDVHMVARICQVGHGGQILLSQTTQQLGAGDLPDGVNLRDLGEHHLKDLSRPQRLFQVIIPDLPSDFPPLGSIDVLPNNLPIQLTSFIGRERAMEEVKRLLASRRLLTLTGPGGCGKTRLALQVAADLIESFRDGVWLVELASLTDPTLVPQIIASALRVREQPGRPVLSALLDYLQLREILIVLDNCEHLVEASASFAETVLRACPDLRILTTSQEPLRLDGETTWLVPSLPLPNLSDLPPLERLTEYEAIRLFIERAAAALPGFTVTARNASSVAQVCDRLDGIPLAIELAAARVRVLPVEQIASRLDDRFRLLTGGSRTILPRHQTLRATMDWSYNLLPERERSLLQRLSVFAGGWTLEAAEAVCGDNGIEWDEVLEELSQLVQRSLVIVDLAGEETRYRLLETVRQYAREKLMESARGEEVRRRHLEWFLGFAERVEPELLGSGEAWLDRLEVDHDNLRKALEWSLKSGKAEAGLRLAGALRRFWLVRGHWTEGRQWLDALLAIGRGASPSLQAKALGAAGSLAQHQGDYERTMALSEESLAICRELGDKQGMASALNTLGNVLYERGSFQAARALHEEGLVCAREAGDRNAIASALVNLAGVAVHEGDYSRAAILAEESLVAFRDAGDRRGIAAALNMLGILAADQGEYDAARSWFEESLAIRRESGDKRGLATSLSSLGLAAQGQGDYAAARSYFEESLPIRRELGDKRGIASALRNLGVIAWHLSDRAQAAAFLKESLALRKAQANRSGIAECVEDLARLAPHAEQAARLLGAAAALRDAIGAPLPPSDQADHDRSVATLRGTLGAHAFKIAWDLGRAMTPDQAIEEALAVTAT